MYKKDFILDISPGQLETIWIFLNVLFLHVGSICITYLDIVANTLVHCSYLNNKYGFEQCKLWHMGFPQVVYASGLTAPVPSLDDLFQARR